MSAVKVEGTYDDPVGIVDLIRCGGPLWPLANYAANDAEMATLAASTNATFTPPWFRQDVVRNAEVLLDGAEAILWNRSFIEAAHELAGPGGVVEPTSVYVNIMGPTPFSFPPHLDVPAFVGITRADYPIWLLKVMMSSGLFEPWRVRIATAVSWFYDGPGGEFYYWPAGMDGPIERIESPYNNVSVVADNERTFHAVGPVGPPDAQMPEGLGSDCRLVRGDGGWDIVDGAGAHVAHFDDHEVRVTVSWKANLYASQSAHDRVKSGQGALTLDDVVARFSADLSERGVAHTLPTDPLNDPDWTAVLASTYPEVAPAFPQVV